MLFIWFQKRLVFMAMLSFFRPSRLIAVLALALPLAACAGDEGEAPAAPRAGSEIREVPAETLYSNALLQMDKGNW